MANFQSSIFFPLNLLLLIPNGVGWNLLILSQLVLGLIGMYLFLSVYTKSKISTLFGSVCFVFSGYAIGWLEWGNIGFLIGLLPLSLYQINSLYKDFKLKKLIFLFIDVVLILLVGHLQFAFYAIAAITGFILYMSIFNSAARVTFLIASTVITAILTTSFQLIPTFELIGNSMRGLDISYIGQSDWFIPRKHFISLLSPDFFGSPARLNYWGVWNHLEFNMSISVVGLVIVFFTPLKRKINIFLFPLLLIALLFATQNPISLIIYQNKIPFLSSAQPSRLIFLIIFCLSVFAAQGMDQLYKLQISFKKIIITSTMFTTLMVILYMETTYNFDIFQPIDYAKNLATAQRNLILPAILLFFALLVIIVSKFKLLPQKILLSILLVTTALELAYSANRFLSTSTSDMFYPNTSLIQFLKHDEGVFRFATTDDRIMPPNLSAVYKLQSVDGYDPLYLKNYAQLVSMIETGKTEDIKFNRIIRPKNHKSNLFKLLNAKYILALDELGDPFKLVFHEGDSRVYIDPTTNERAYFAEKTTLVKSDEESKIKLLDADFDPKKDAVVFKTQSKSYTVSPDDKVEIHNYQSSEIKLSTETKNDSFLVLLDTYYPGWKAKIDGRSIPVYRTNHAFRGISVPAGRHEIVFYYRPDSLLYGLIVSLISISCFSILLLTARKYVKQN